jgi:hypothetical protein
VATNVLLPTDGFSDAFGLGKSTGTYDLSGSLIGDAQHNLSATLIGQGATVLRQLVKVVLRFPFLEFELLTFLGFEQLFKLGQIAGHTPSLQSVTVSSPLLRT